MTLSPCPECGKKISSEAAACPYCGYFQQKIPGMFLFLGVTPKDLPPAQAAPLHSPRFRIDEDALMVGVRTLARLTLNRLTSK